MKHRPDTDVNIEAAVTAWRPRAPDGRILPHPAWADLDRQGRIDLFNQTQSWRALEAAQGTHSTTARNLLRLIRKRS